MTRNKLTKLVSVALGVMMLVAPYSALATVTIDNFGSVIKDPPASTATFSFSITPSGGTVMVCGVVADSGAAPTSVTWNTTENLTQSAAGGTALSVWYLAAPTGGTHSILVTWASAVYSTVSCSSFNGADTSNPIDGYGTGSGNPIGTATFNTAYGGTMLYTVGGLSSGAGVASGGSTIIDTLHNNSDNYYGTTAYKLTTTAGSNSIAINASGAIGLNAVGIKDANPPATETTGGFGTLIVFGDL